MIFLNKIEDFKSIEKIIKKQKQLYAKSKKYTVMYVNRKGAASRVEYVSRDTAAADDAE